AVPVLVCSVPLHLDLRVHTLVRGLGVVAAFRERHQPLVQVGEAHGERIHVGVLIHESERDVHGILPGHGRLRLLRNLDHLGISTTTSPRTTASQPRRECKVCPSAVSRRSSSSCSIVERFYSPSRTTT